MLGGDACPNAGDGRGAERVREVVQAVPVKRAGSQLTGGAFDATATLVVDYH